MGWNAVLVSSPLTAMTRKAKEWVGGLMIYNSVKKTRLVVQLIEVYKENDLFQHRKGVQKERPVKTSTEVGGNRKTVEGCPGSRKTPCQVGAPGQVPCWLLAAFRPSFSRCLIIFKKIKHFGSTSV